jgi:signal transduction histidine kinase
VRRRILTSIVVLTALAVVVFAVPLGFALADLYHEEEVVKLQKTSAEAAEEVPASFPRHTDPIELEQRPNRLVGLYRPDGTRVAGRGPAVGDSVVRAALRGDLRDETPASFLVVGTPVTRGERVIGALRVAAPESVVSDRLRDAVLLMIGIGAFAVGISALIAVYQSRRLAQPVDDLAAVAARLGDGDFTVRTATSGVPEIDAVSDTLRTTATRLDQMLQRERTFSEDTSHQLRTPLTGLRVNLEAARLSPGSDHDAELDAALSEVDRLERTVDDLLILAREPPVARTPIDLGPILADLEDDWHGRLAAAGRRLRVDRALGLPEVAVSPRAVRQVLDVLVENAWRHGQGTITVSARSAGGGVALEVSDEGEGVSGDPERIFERRETTTPGGTGIGLALARSLAESEGGRLVLERARPGALFALVLPAAWAADEHEGFAVR